MALANQLAAREPVVDALDHVSDQVVVLNEDRRIVFCNRAFREAAGGEEAEAYWGRPLGHVVGCQHAIGDVSLCGTTESCMVCGALKSILMAGRGQSAREECRITLAGGEPLDVRVSGEPYEVDGHRLSFLTINDISDLKRRRLLERIFFHDLVNTAGGIQTISELLEEAESGEVAEYHQLLQGMSRDLLHDIRSQQILSAAETGDLLPAAEPLQLGELVAEVRGRLDRLDLVRDRGIKVLNLDELPELEADPRLLRRVVENMLRNALEASGAGEVVTVSGEVKDGERGKGKHVWLTVHNASFMPRHVQLQVFNRFFSTKGEGRGFGTYSIKLLGERYLGGKVGFTSDPALGTTFFIGLPVVR